MIGDLRIPTCLDGTPSLLEFGRIGFGEMCFRIALHMNGAELDIRTGKETSTNGQKARKVVVNQNHQSAKTAFNQPPKNPFPAFKTFSTRLGNATEDALLTIQSEPHGKVDAGRTQLVAFSQL